MGVAFVPERTAVLAVRAASGMRERTAAPVSLSL